MKTKIVSEYSGMWHALLVLFALTMLPARGQAEQADAPGSAANASVHVARAQGGAQPRAASSAGGKKPNIVVLMYDDTGWADFGAYLGGAALGHPTPNVDRMAKEGTMFTSRYGQASCTAGRASFMTGRYPRSARRWGSWSRRATRTRCAHRHRPSPSSSRRTATAPTSRASWGGPSERLQPRRAASSPFHRPYTEEA